MNHVLQTNKTFSLPNKSATAHHKHGGGLGSEEGDQDRRENGLYKLRQHILNTTMLTIYILMLTSSTVVQRSAPM